MLKYRTRLGIGTAAILTATVGVINLLSAVTPNLPERNFWLRDVFPFEIRARGHIFAALSGFFLLALSANLGRRKRVAWLLTQILLIISIFSHLIKGFDYEESLLSLALFILLFLMRGVFTARSDPPSTGQGIRVFIGALLFTLAYGTAGFFLLDTHYSINFDLGAALGQTLAMFLTQDNGGLQPITPFGRFFADSIYVVGSVTISYALWMLLRPVLLRGLPATEAQRQKAKAIVTADGRSSLAHFILMEDKAYYFSPSGQTFIAYVPKGRGAIALGDPIGPLADRREAIVSFREFCRLNDWHLGFYQTSPDSLELYHSLGFKSLKIGEEAIVNLKTFSLQGKAAKNFRYILNRFTKSGYQFKIYQPPITEAVLNQLQEVSDEWLQMVQGSEKKFSLGWFDRNYLRDCTLGTVEENTGQIKAFANIVPEYQLNEITVDLMRHRQVIENGTMDFLFISLFQHFQAQGYDGFNLGLSALFGLGANSHPPRLEKVLHYLYEHLDRFYKFQGLHEYKAKFQPRWESRYLIYPSATSLLDVVIALIRADSGDRLLDYFKPGS